MTPAALSGKIKVKWGRCQTGVLEREKRKESGRVRGITKSRAKEERRRERGRERERGEGT